MSINNVLTNTRFFLNTRIQGWLLDRYNTAEDRLIPSGCNFKFDIIEQPFHCSIYSDGDGIDVKLYVRNEMGVLEERPDLGIKILANGEKASVTFNTHRVGGDISKTMAIFLKIAVAINEYIAERGLTDELSNINTESEGIIVSLNKNELSFKRVIGKKRPALACATLFGGVEMSRPYLDEIADAWADEMLPFEEKLELAEGGDEEMMEQLALVYLNGDENVEADPVKAVYWFNRLAERDNPNAQFNLGLHYAKGFGVPRDFAKAAYWMQKAADNGDTDALILVEKYTKAVEALKKINSSDAQAQADLATILMSLAGSLEQAGTGDDYAMAFDLAAKSAAQNNGDGIWVLALAYEHGRGVAKDVNKAIELYRKGAELGHAPSQHSLACYYFRGDVLEANHEKAFELCMKSAEQNYGLAMADIGKCYQFGTHVECDMKQALVWYEKALEAIEDPELEAKVAIFKMLEANGGLDDTSVED